MNIIFFSKRGFNPKSGGIERVSDMLATAFQTRSHKVFYVTCFEEAEYDHFIPRFEQLVMPDKKNICSTQNVNAFCLFVEKHNIDIIICQYSFELDVAELPYLVKKQKGVKLLYVFHSSPNFPSLELRDLSYPLLPSEKQPHKQFKRIMRLMLRNQKIRSRDKKSGLLFKSLHYMGDGLVLLTEKYIPVVQRIAEIRTQEKFYVIANPNTYSESEIEIAKKENLVLFVGRLSKEKRPEKAMLVWQKIQHQFPDWKFEILGVGRLESDVEKLVKSLKLERCSIEGRQDPRTYYAKAKIILMLSDYEGFPLVLTEAMQHGVTPVVFHSFEALNSVVENAKNGYTVTAFDLLEFEIKLADLMKNEDIREKMSIEAIQSVKKFDIQEIVNKWEEVFLKIC